MKSYLFLISFLFIIIYTNQSYGQRYIENVFTTIERIDDIAYGNSVNDLGSSQDLLLDFYQPEGDSDSNRPLIIWIHGGSFTSGSKRDFSLETFTDFLVPKGYTTAHISYRLSSDPVLIENSQIDTLSLYKAVHNAVHDARAAVRYFKINNVLYNIDPDRIYIAGISAGAITALELAYIDKLDELYPDALPLSIEGESGSNGADSQVAGVISLCGTTVFPEIIEGPTDPPLFMAHDLRDPIVPYANAQATFDQANAVGLPAVANFYDSGLHCSWSIPIIGLLNLIDVQNQLRSFLFASVSTSVEAAKPTIARSQIFPQPFSSHLTIKRHLSQIRLRIFNSLGQLLSSESFWSEKQIDTSSWSPGLYLVEINDEIGGTEFRSIIKSN